MQKLNIDDIARLAYVSRSVVSRVLNQRPNVSSEARERVLAVIEKYNYRPSATARSLATDRTYEISILAPRKKDEVFANGFWSLIFLGISERCVERGYTVPDWPEEYGGAGLSKQEVRVLRKEMAALRCRAPIFNYGISMLAPVLLEYGTDEQKAEHLPPIARGEIRWCQGYSEPGAGSDLAGLQCRAVRDGDEYVVNGQKIWTSDADVSDWIFALVRTNTEVPKHDGISFLLFDMESKGVSVSPIPLISGASPFCQTFLDDVRVPARNLIGKENGGWKRPRRRRRAKG